ncbi:hypothetical protein HYDPIDRAFT_33009 [Hydnomerulius pinastri MD-312]|uniref:Uncharacterized protein n=1 Tax=Hydnomerulius pinastri MD-312 TaxID=994086 RepID=A0A0C9VPU4_9AGAM|nr:hypothetical protein HYDPIDRAFT_33009 [Hydnomerulius pinastri MD-312]
MDRIRKDWWKEIFDHRARHQHWNQEEQNHSLVLLQWEAEAQAHENQRERWKREEENHDHLEEERRKREEEERLKHNMYWDLVEKRQCTTYATREYSAQLMNLPSNWIHRVEACKATPLVVHGVSYLPSTCEDKGPGVVTGRWEINQNEPDCATCWGSYKDEESSLPRVL